jgi:uncharacterized protein (TIGR03083 family)
MTPADLLVAIADERRRLADMLDTFTPEQWDHASLCEGWTNRCVVAHLTMGLTMPTPKFILEMLKAGFNFNTAADRFAKHESEKSTAELIDTLRKNADHRFKPPGANYDAPLTDIIVHGLDIRRPLGIDRDVATDRWTAVLDLLAKPKTQKFFNSTLPDVNLTATDIGWTTGSGNKSITATAENLALLLAKRRVDPAHFSGDGVHTLGTR